MTVRRSSMVTTTSILWSLVAPRSMLTSALVTTTTPRSSSSLLTSSSTSLSSSMRHINQLGLYSPSSNRLFSTAKSSSQESSETSDKTLADIHDFWFPVPEGHSADDDSSNRAYMNDASYLGSQINDWFFGGDDMDEKSRAFQSLIRSEKSKHRASDLSKDTHVDLIAKVVMFDQIVRNAFRFNDEAFAYEDEVKDILEFLFQVKDDDQTEITEEALSEFVNKDEVTFCDCYFIAVALMHQEKAIFHGVDIRMYKYVLKKWPENQSMVEKAVDFSKDHSDVLKRFGRYPHRNEQKGRETTAEEFEWLNDYDNLPVWAKSQLTKKE